MTESTRKPFNNDAGYVCSLKTGFGHVVVYDREKGGDWIDASTRWVLAAYNHDKENIGLLDCRTIRQARSDMKLTRDGMWDWIEQFQKPDYNYSEGS